MTGRIDRWERDGCGITVYIPSRAEEGLPVLYVGDGGWVSGDAGLWNALTEAAEAIPCLLAAVEPPSPVQLVWKNCPLGLSSRS